MSRIEICKCSTQNITNNSNSNLSMPIQCSGTFVNGWMCISNLFVCGTKITKTKNICKLFLMNNTFFMSLYDLVCLSICFIYVQVFLVTLAQYFSFLVNVKRLNRDFVKTKEKICQLFSIFQRYKKLKFWSNHNGTMQLFDNNSRAKQKYQNN